MTNILFFSQLKSPPSLDILYFQVACNASLIPICYVNKCYYLIIIILRNIQEREESVLLF